MGSDHRMGVKLISALDIRQIDFGPVALPAPVALALLPMHVQNPNAVADPEDRIDVSPSVCLSVRLSVHRSA